MATQTPAIEKKIAAYVHQLNDRQKKTVLNVVKTFVEDQKDWWNDLSNEQRESIKEAEAELDAGLGVPHEEVMKKYRKWL